MKRLFLFFLFLCFFVCSCSTTYVACLQDESFQAEGLTSGELLTRFGAPAREMSDGRGGRILVFTGDKVFDYQASKFSGSLPELQCFMDANDVCFKYEMVNMKSKGVFSFGKTLLLLILLGIIPLAV